MLPALKTIKSLFSSLSVASLSRVLIKTHHYIVKEKHEVQSCVYSASGQRGSCRGKMSVKGQAYELRKRILGNNVLISARL